MLGFINPLSSRHIKGGITLPEIDRSYPVPSVSFSGPARASTESLATLGALNGSSNGVAVTARFKNTNWRHAGTEILLKIGDANNYLYFQKRQSGYKFRWGLVSNGNIQLIDEFSVDYLYDGTVTIGASVTSDEIVFTMNGMTLSYQTTNIALPDITAVDSLYIGHDIGGGQQANTSVVFDHVSVWDIGLSKTNLENATFEPAPLDGVTFDNNLYFVIKAGQSNSKADSDSIKPLGYDYAKPASLYNLSKGHVLSAYSDPYTHLDDGNVFNAFNDVGGFSAAGVTIDRLAQAYPSLKFAVTPCNMAGTGLVNETNAGKWGRYSGALVTTGNATRVSIYALATYLTMIIVAQYGHILAFEWYQGETDGQDESTVTETQYQSALTTLLDDWRVMLPSIRVMVGLGDTPAAQFSNWNVIRTAQANFTYPNMGVVSAQGLDVLTSEDYHLNGQGQKDLGDLVADQILSSL